jgi:superoxide dismutase, Fe-Mn family
MNRRQLIQNLGLLSGAAFIGAPGLLQTTLRGQTPPTGPHTLPPLNYAFDALEPFIDAQTMQIHHDRHHAAYVNNLNTLMAKYPDLAKLSAAQLMSKLDTVPAADRSAVRNNAGGHVNHTFFWQCLKKNEGGKPSGDLLKAIETKFKSWDQFQSDFSAAATTVFGSGWAWLVKNDKGELDIVKTFAQDNPWMQTNRIPVLGIDVWEHAYYLKYQNRRPDYIKAFWNVINWDFVASEYAKKA